jgi:hypothetical protein
VVVERLPGVAVFPIDGTGRRWWRDTTFAQRDRRVELTPNARWLSPPMPTQMNPGDRQALAALRRAVTARDPVQRVVALWEAIEFYVGDRSPEARFTDAEVNEAIGRAREGLSGAKAERVGKSGLWVIGNSIARSNGSGDAFLPLRRASAYTEHRGCPARCGIPARRGHTQTRFCLRVLAALPRRTLPAPAS